MIKSEQLNYAPSQPITAVFDPGNNNFVSSLIKNPLIDSPYSDGLQINRDIDDPNIFEFYTQTGLFNNNINHVRINRLSPEILDIVIWNGKDFEDSKRATLEWDQTANTVGFFYETADGDLRLIFNTDNQTFSYKTIKKDSTGSTENVAGEENVPLNQVDGISIGKIKVDRIKMDDKNIIFQFSRDNKHRKWIKIPKSVKFIDLPTPSLIPPPQSPLA